MSNAEKHIFKALDAARGVAALAVTCYHTIDHRWLPSGFLAVDFFFALSGFVLASAYQSRLLSGELGVMNFMRIRLIRLYPLYVLGLVLCLLANLPMFPWSAFALAGKLPFAFAMLPAPTFDFRAPLYPFMIPAWSLFFELVANFGFALFCRPLRKPLVRWLVIGVCALSMVLQIKVFGIVESGVGWGDALFGVGRVTLFFVLGLHVHDWYVQRVASGHGALHPTWVTTLALAALLACMWTPPGGLLQIMVPLLVMPLLILTLASASLGAGAVSLALHRLGMMSFALYAIHWSVITLYERVLLLNKIPLDHWPWASPGLIAVSLAVAWAAERWYDLPARRLLVRLAERVRMLARRKARTNPAASP